MIHDPKSRLRRLIRILGAADGLVVEKNLISGPEPRNESKSKVIFRDNTVKDMTSAFVDPDKGNVRLKK